MQDEKGSEKSIDEMKQEVKDYIKILQANVDDLKKQLIQNQ